MVSLPWSCLALNLGEYPNVTPWTCQQILSQCLYFPNPNKVKALAFFNFLYKLITTTTINQDIVSGTTMAMVMTNVTLVDFRKAFC